MTEPRAIVQASFTGGNQKPCIAFTNPGLTIEQLAAILTYIAQRHPVDQTRADAALLEVVPTAHSPFLTLRLRAGERLVGDQEAIRVQTVFFAMAATLGWRIEGVRFSSQS